MYVDWTYATPAELAVAILRAPTHLAFPLRAVRDAGCAYVFVSQGRCAFAVPTDRPAIVLIGDDLSCALGPAGFHRRALRRCVARCQAAAIIACAPLPYVYEQLAAQAAERRRDALIIETRPEREAEWLDYVKAEAPADVAVVVATVHSEGAG